LVITNTQKTTHFEGGGKTKSPISPLEKKKKREERALSLEKKVEKITLTEKKRRTF